MCVQTLERKCRSCEMITIVLERALSTSSSQRMLWISRLLVGSSRSRMSGSPKSACASSTRSFQPGATALIGPWCCDSGTPRPRSSAPARASAGLPPNCMAMLEATIIRILKMKKLAARPAFLEAKRLLERLDVRRGRAFLALRHVERDLLPLFEGLVARTLDRGVMGEEVLAAVIRRDESETLRVVEPLYGTCRHIYSIPD